MKIKNDLVERVRKGEAAIFFKVHIDSPYKLNEVVNTVKEKHIPFDGVANYYFLNKYYVWGANDFLPFGMVAIPLDDFFEEEKEEEIGAGQLFDNHFDCYTELMRDGKLKHIEAKAMTREKFIEVFHRGIWDGILGKIMSDLWHSAQEGGNKEECIKLAIKLLKK